MPSLWSWLSKRKHKLNSSKQPEYTKNLNDHYRRKQVYDQQGKVVPQTNIFLDTQTPLPSNQPENINKTPKTELEKTFLGDGSGIKSKVNNDQQDNLVSKRRPLACEIFDNTFSPTRNITQERNNLQRDSNSGQPTLHRHEASSSPPRSQKVIVDTTGDEIKQHPQRFNIFGGVSSQFHRHSLQAVYPGQGRDIKRVPDSRRSETMAGYVPKAVCILDTSSILSGRLLEKTPPSKFINVNNYRISETPFWILQKSQVMPNVKSSSSQYHQMFQAPRQQAQCNTKNVRRNSKQSKIEMKKLDKLSAQFANKPRQRTTQENNASSSSSASNFYFSSSFLSPILSNQNTVLESSRMDAHSPQVSHRTKHTTLTENSQHNEGNLNNTKDTPDSNNNFVITKTSDDCPDLSHHITSINKNNNDEDNDDNVTSSFGNVNTIMETIAAKTDSKYFEGIFNTEDDVLY